MARVLQCVVDAIEEAGNRGRTPLVADSGLGHELGPARRHVVATPRRVVVLRQTVVEASRHLDLHPHRRIRIG